MEVFGLECYGRVCGYVAGVTPTKLWGSSLSRMHDLEKWLHEFEHKHLEADADLKEEVKHLKSMLEQPASQMADQSKHFVEQKAIQMAEQRRHLEEQQASQMAEQRTHFDKMMMQMLSYITSQSAQSSSDR